MYNNKEASWFKNGDFKNHILNEHNIPITEDIINGIFKKYNFNHVICNLNNFQIALTHVSYLKKSAIKDKTAILLKDIEPISDEKKKNVMPLQQRDYNTFEYQGDAVIHLALTQYLYKRYPKSDQGFLTKLRTKLEKAETLSYLSKRMNLHKYVVIARNMEYNGARHNDVHLTEDIFEAFMCALFLEETYDKCKEFMISIIENEIDFSELISCDDNYKEKIMHYFHKMKLKDPSYVDSELSQKNNADAVNQILVVYIKTQEGNIIGVGSGNTKSKAEQDAARDALVKLGILQNSQQERDSYYGEESDGYFECESDSDIEKIDYAAWFKDKDFVNHILNEKNVLITDKFVNNIFKKYGFNHKVKNYPNYLLSTIHISYLQKTILKDKTALLLKDISPISDQDKKLTVPLQKRDYSRLGHLGNAVIHLILTQYLCKRYSSKDQGFLTKLRTKIEKAETLSNVSKRLGFDKYAIIARNMEFGDARSLDINLTKGIFEAFIGSLSFETDYDSCYKFLITLIEQEVDIAELLETDDNYKEQIMQYFHKMLWKDPKYVDVKCDPEAKLFVVCVKNQQGNILGTGSNITKNKAEQDAAHDALIKLKVIGNIGINDNTDDFYGEDDR
jgi:dsRNA-specific ribonuclease